MGLTADQVRLQLRQVAEVDSDYWKIRGLLNILETVLPDLAEENARLRRALLLSEASRGVPSNVGGE